MEGQLWPEERALLRRAVLINQPKLVLETGTWKGGGSTATIAEALRELGAGELHTCEVDPFCYAEAIHGHEAQFITNLEAVTPDGVIHFYCRPSGLLIQQLLQQSQIPDLLFWDGPEDPTVALSDLRLLEPKLGPEAQFLCHDWHLGPGRTDGCVSRKAELIRPYLESSHNWQLVRRLEPPQSVGLCWYRRIT